MLRKYLTFLLVVLLGLMSLPKAYASMIFSDPVIGNIGDIWNNPGWIYHDSLYGIYDNNGAHRHYYPWKDVNTQDQIIKWTYHYGNAQDILSIRCRISYDGLNTEQVTIYPHTSPNIDEGVNGIYVGKALFTANTVGDVNGELDCIGDTLVYKENGILKATYIMNPDNNATGVAFYSSGDGDTSVSNIQICTPSSCNDLSVPLLKQTDSHWGDMTYDSADVWFPQNPKISRWGCALTSTAMIMQYYGITKLPDNTDLNPGTLNTWLENQPDGYLGEGNFNWIAMTRLSKLAKNNNPLFAYDALEFAKGGDDSSLLTNDITNGRPDVLEEPGHFIVATGINGNTFDINDPAYNRTILTDGYHNNFIRLERYIPSHTDLSYIMLTVDPSVNIKIETATQSAIGDQYVEEPYGDPTNPTATGGSPLKIVYIPKPQSGIYTVTVSSAMNQTYTLGSYLYDIDGSVNKKTFPGSLISNTPQAFTIDFDNQNSTNSSTEEIVTFRSFIQDVNSLTNSKQMNKIFQVPLLALIDAAENSADHKRKAIEKIQLDAIQAFLNIFHNKGISTTAYQILSQDDQYLKNHL